MEDGTYIDGAVPMVPSSVGTYIDVGGTYIDAGGTYIDGASHHILDWINKVWLGTVGKVVTSNIRNPQFKYHPSLEFFQPSLFDRKRLSLRA